MRIKPNVDHSAAVIGADLSVADNTAAVVTLAAVAGKRQVIDWISYSYDGAPDADTGRLSVAVAGSDVLATDVVAGGPEHFQFGDGKYGGIPGRKGDTDTATTGTVVGNAVFGDPESTVTISTGEFVASDVGRNLRFDTSGVAYPIITFTSSTVVDVTGDASGEAAGDTFRIAPRGEVIITLSAGAALVGGELSVGSRVMNIHNNDALPIIRSHLAVADNGAGAINMAADAQSIHVIDWILCSYDATPTGGIAVALAGTSIWAVDVITAGPKFFKFGNGQDGGIHGDKNQALVIATALGGAGVGVELTAGTR